jgi:hypothetical protein
MRTSNCSRRSVEQQSALPSSIYPVVPSQSAHSCVWLFLSGSRTGVVDFDIVEVLVIVEIIKTWSHVGGCGLLSGGRGCRYSISMCKKVQERAESRVPSTTDDSHLPRTNPRIVLSKTLFLSMRTNNMSKTSLLKTVLF